MTIPEEKGSFLKFCQLLAGVRSPSSTTVLPMPKTPASCRCAPEPRPRRAQRNFADAHDGGYSVVDLSDDEMAKLHVAIWSADVHRIRCRNASTASNPGITGRAAALPQHAGYVLELSLFHYRSHGTDYGRVLAAFNLATMNRISKPG